MTSLGLHFKRSTMTHNSDDNDIVDQGDDVSPRPLELRSKRSMLSDDINDNALASRGNGDYQANRMDINEGSSF